MRSADGAIDCLVLPNGAVDPASPVEIDQIIEVTNPTGPTVGLAPSIDITNGTGSTVEFDSVALSIGGVFNFVPEPAAAAQAVAALATLFALRRHRRRPN